MVSKVIVRWNTTDMCFVVDCEYLEAESVKDEVLRVLDKGRRNAEVREGIGHMYFVYVK